MPRSDISSKVIHFTKGQSGQSLEEAFVVLSSILSQRRLVGSANLIKGNYRCVCFTEAPLESLRGGFVNPSDYSRYSPFGIILDKAWLFQSGGRPVIYQEDSEFYLLPETLRWRHVRYQPGTVDFTWEREWRLQSEELNFQPNDVGIVVPDSQWADRLRREHDSEQRWRIMHYSQIMDEVIAAQYFEHFPWRVYTLIDPAAGP